MCSPQTDAKPVCLQGFILMLASIVKLSRPPKVLFAVELAGMQLAFEIEIRLKKKPAFCTICESKCTEDAILEDKEATFCRSISSYPTYWHASTALLVMLISRCSFIFIHCDTPQVTNELLCFTSPTLHPPRTSLSRIWF